MGTKNQDDWMAQCVPEKIGEGYDYDQAVAVCLSMYEENQGGEGSGDQPQPGDSNPDGRQPPGTISTLQDSKGATVRAFSHSKGGQQGRTKDASGERKLVDFPLDVKQAKANDSGDVEFEGYASVFGVVDSDLDVIAPGAFSESLKQWREAGRMPPLLWQHDWANPIGRYDEIREDEQGLYVRGRLFVGDIPAARQAARLIQERAIDGLSIGFMPQPPVTMDEYTLVRTFFKLDLLEVSVVTFPALEVARIDAAREASKQAGNKQAEQAGEGGNDAAIQAGDIPRLETLAEAEALLRRAGFSKNAATRYVSGLRNLVAAEDSSSRGEPGEEGNGEELAKQLHAIASKLTTGGNNHEHA